MDQHKLLALLLLAPFFVVLPLVEADLEQSFLVLLLTTLSAASLLLMLRRELHIHVWVFRAVLLFSAVLLISTMFSPVLNNSALTFLTWMAVLMSFLVVLVLSHDEKLRHLVLVLLVAGSFLTVIRSFYFYLYSSVPSASRYMHGVFHDSSSMGGFLVLIIPLVLTLTLRRQKTWSQALLLVVTCLLTTSLVLTRARAAWVASGFGVGLILLPLLIFQIRKKGVPSLIKAPWAWILVLLSFATLVILSTFSSPRVLLGRVESLTQLSDPTVSAQSQEIIPYDTGLIHRLTLWENSWLMVQDHPWFGIGLGNFGRVYHQYQDQAWIFATDPHNGYLNVVTESGFLGLFSFLALLGVVFWQSRARWLASLVRPFEDIVTLGLVAGSLALLAHMMVDYSFSAISTQIYFFTILGILVPGGRSLAEKQGVIPDLIGDPVSLLDSRFHGNDNHIHRLVFSFLVLFFLALSLVLYFAVVNYQKGELALQEGDAEAASKHFQTSLNLNPTQAYVYERLGVNALQQKNSDLAVSFLETSLAHDPTIGEVYGELAIAYYGQGDLVKTEQFLKLAIEKGPYATPRYYNALAKFYLDQGKSDQALATYELALISFPLNDVWKTYQHLYSGMNDELVELYVSASQILSEKGGKTRSEGLIKQLQEGFRSTGEL